MFGWWVVFACSAAAPPGVLEFVRGGVVSPSVSHGVSVGKGRSFVALNADPGELVTVDGLSDVVPERPGCATLATIDLGDVSRLVAAGGEAPDTALAFDPSGQTLAIGAWTGEVIVANAWTGAVVARRTLPEAVVKRVAWSADGGTLYVGEQSPDGLVRALDPATLADRWTFRIADDVGYSPAPPPDDLYGVYALPGVYGLSVLEGGDLLVTGVHGWAAAEGRKNASRVWRLGPNGEVRGAFPALGAADGTLFAVRERHGLLIAAASRSADGPPAVDLPYGGVVILDAERLTEVGRVMVPPLLPYFDRVFIWEAVDLDAERREVLIGTGDGRAFVAGFDGQIHGMFDPGAPISVGGVPVSASIGFGAFVGDQFAVETSGTTIPYGAADPSLRPPDAHPGENSLFVAGRDGQLARVWRGPYRLQGLDVSVDGQWLVAGAGQRASDTRTDLFGGLLFPIGDLNAGPIVCPTESPVFFRSATTADGRLALVEHPWLAGDTLQGAYRVVIAR